ncbi:MAG TPA: ATP-binding protein [Usitatibacter sp.]|nr:ATP-binding protein [Usitatibacter sp.]
MSIRHRLLVWLLSSVLAGGLLAAGVVFFQARAEANQLFDYQLRQLALTLRDRIYLPSQLAEVLQGEEALDFVIQVWAPDGTRLYISHPKLHVPSAVQLGFSEVRTEEGRWRVFAIQQRGLTIQVAQPLSARGRLALAAAWRTLIPFLIALPLIGLLIWRLVGRELRFLESTAQAVARRTPEALEPIAGEAIPEEIQPLVAALNGLLGRLGHALSQQRHFIADAAHELRTPLTALRLQLQLAERAQDPADRERAHAMLRDGIARATRVVEQLLALARQDPDAPVESRAPVDLAELARNVAHAQAATAEGRGLSLGVEGAPAVASGDANALRTLLENLLDNAIRYTPSGHVTLRTGSAGGEAWLEVEDSGPGIPRAERERVFDRFYRGEAIATGGSGLGLAIVRRIAERHRGRVELLDPVEGRGLRARVTLPAAE